MKEKTLDLPDTILVGTGVVGEAILTLHVTAGFSVCVVDQDEMSLERAIKNLSLPEAEWETFRGTLHRMGDLPAIMLHRRGDSRPPSARVLIESIPERQDIKETFYSRVEKLVPPETVICSNTSTMRITELAKPLKFPNRFCGMHFFMPVEKRAAVEVIRGEQTSDVAYDLACQHVVNLRKAPLAVKDTPGFIVNRLLSPYLNESLRLLCRGVSAERIERAAKSYGMPMSPLELIDTIGLRTVFDAGRVYWQAFPKRMDPSPLLAGLVKAKRLGAHCGSGVYDYVDGKRSAGLSPAVQGLIDRYRESSVHLSEDRLVDRLSIPMFIEAAIAYRSSAVDDCSALNLAMSGGLGFGALLGKGENTWLDFFDGLGSHRVLNAIEVDSSESKAMQAEPWLIQTLREQSPSTAIVRSRQD